MGQAETDTDTPPGRAPFGALVRRYREAAALSQAALAQRAGLSTDAISVIERGKRGVPRPDTVALLAQALELSAAERATFIAAARARARPTRDPASVLPPPAPLRPSRPLLPALPAPMTGFIGREREVGAVRDRLLDPPTRLLTLTGMGGIGKTRLALQVALQVRDAFPDGVVMVDLAPLADPALVVPLIARTLGLTETGSQPLREALHAALRERRLLLLLDNVEHLLAAAGEVSALLTACAHVRVLATSRAALRLYGERLYPVPPLSLPALPAPSVETLLQAESVRLFLARAQDVAPDFAVTDETAPRVAAICAQLDGLPLAIELAATRVRLFTLDALLARLTHRLEVLTDGPRDVPVRQRTMRATIDWSYGLLTVGEQTLLARLSVFAGGATVEAIEAVCAGDGTVDALDGVTSLLEKSLLRRTAVEGEVRFALLETVREYARGRLEARGEAATLQAAHAAYYLALAEEAKPHLSGSEQAMWLARLEREHDNFRAALAWAREHGEGELGLRLGGALWRFWSTRGYLSEGRRWLDAALGESGAVPATARAQALTGAGALAEEQGDYRPATALYEEALALRRKLGNRWDIAHALNGLGILATCQGDYRRARALYKESLALCREVGDTQGIATSLNNLSVVATAQGNYGRAMTLAEGSLAVVRELGNKRGIAITLMTLGIVATSRGDYERATARFEESLALRREVGDARGIAGTLTGLGAVAYCQGSYGRATALYEQGLAMCRALGDKRIAAYCLEGLAGVACDLERPQRAARLFGAAAALRATIGAPLPRNERPRHDSLMASVRRQLDEGTFATAWAAGQGITLEQAIADALEDGAHP